MVLWALVGGLVGILLINFGAGVVAERYSHRRHPTISAQNGAFELRPSLLCALPSALLAFEFSIGLAFLGLSVANVIARVLCIGLAVLIAASVVGQIRVARVTADEREVESRNWFGVTDRVNRAELQAIAVAGNRNPVLLFVKKDGRSAFAIPQRWWRPDNIGALADYLRVPLRGAVRADSSR